MARHSHRKVTRLDGVYDLRVKVYQCLNRECSRFRQVCRPEEEGSWALPHGEFGLDVIALVGALRYREQRSIPQIHQELLRRGLQVAQRSVTDQLYRYEELLAVNLTDVKRRKRATQGTEAGHLGSRWAATRCGAGGSLALARLLGGAKCSQHTACLEQQKTI